MNSQLLESLLRSSKQDDVAQKNARASLNYNLLSRSYDSIESFDDVDDASEKDHVVAENDDRHLLQRVFNVRESQVLHTFTAAFLDVSLLPARALLTNATLHIFASVESTVETRAGYLQLKQSTLPFTWTTCWCVLEPADALNLFRSSDPSEQFQPVLRLPFARMSRVQLLQDDETVSRFSIALREPDELHQLTADSRVEAHAWVVALRVAMAATRRRTVKRSVPLASVTSINSPQHDVVFGDGCITLTLGPDDTGERIWLSSVSDFDTTFAQLRNAWLMSVNGVAPPPANTPARNAAAEHPYEKRFQSLFKLHTEALRETYSVGLVVNDYGVVTRARICLTDRFLCVRSNSILKQLLAIVPWSAVLNIEDCPFLMLDVGMNVFVRGGHLLGFVLPIGGGTAEIRHKMRALWASGRHDARNDDLVFSIEEHDASSAGRAASSSSSSSSVDSPSAVFHTARNKMFHEKFVADVPIDETLQDSFACALTRSDTTHTGELHVSQHWFAFASHDGMSVVVPRSSVESAMPTAKTVTLICNDGSEFEFVDFPRVASFLRYVQGEDGGDAVSGNTSAVSVHFYHSQLKTFQQTFAVTDELIDTHLCTLVRSLTVPVIGTLFVGKAHLCFGGKVQSSKIVLRLADVASVTHEKHAFMFQDALRITTTAATSFLFIGFWSLGGTVAQLQQALARSRQPQLALPIAPSALHMSNDNDDDAVAEEALAHKLHEESPLAEIKAPAPLRIVILTIGSRGDVQPTLALGRALQADGHTVTIGTHAEFKSFVEKSGLAHATLAGDPKELMNLCVSNGMFTASFMREALARFGSFIDDLVRSAYAVVKETRAELMIQAPTVFAGAHISEALRVPLINWFTMPHTPTTRFPHPFAVASVPLGGAYNYMSYAAVQQALWQPLATQLNRFREEIGLRPLSRLEGPAINDGVPIIYCFSRHLVPKPADWPSSVHISGFFFDELPSAVAAPPYVPPQDLADFLAAGAPPIYVGFGSITGINDVDKFFDNVVHAIEESQQRCILLTGWANLGQGRKLSERIHVLESVPHDWLFPQCSVVVSHGGAGTLAAGLRAGRPAITVAFFADQFHWGKCVVEMGVGHTFAAADLTASKLRDAIVDAVSNVDMRNKAMTLGALIAAEHGVASAKRAIYSSLQPMGKL